MKNFYEFDEMIRDAFTKGSSVIELGRLPPFHLALGTWHRSRDRPGGRHPFGSYMLNKKWTLGIGGGVHQTYVEVPAGHGDIYLFQFYIF